jgi:hypothetical protein
MCVSNIPYYAAVCTGLLPPQRCIIVLKEFGDEPIADTRFSPEVSFASEQSIRAIGRHRKLS